MAELSITESPAQRQAHDMSWPIGVPPFSWPKQANPEVSDSSGGSQAPLGGIDVIRDPSEVTFPTNTEENREGEREP